MSKSLMFWRVRRAPRAGTLAAVFSVVVLGAVGAGCGVTQSGEVDQAVLESSEVADAASGSDGSQAQDDSLVVNTGDEDADPTDGTDGADDGAASTGSQLVAVLAAGTEDELTATVNAPAGWTSDTVSNTLTDGQSTISLTSGCADCDATDGYLNFFEDVDLDDENLGFGFGFGDDGTTHESIYGLRPDGVWGGQVALSLEGAPLFVGCVAETVDEATLDELTDVCEAMSIGWPPELVEAAMADFEVSIGDDSDSDSGGDSGGEAPEIVEKLTDAAAAVIANPAPDLPRRDVLLELGDDSKSVSVALPADATVGEGFFGVEVSLGASSIFTEIELAAFCDGLSEAKDWRSTLNSSDGHLTNQRTSMDVIDNDSPIDSGWLLSGSGSFDDYTIVVARWNDAVDEFMLCEASVDEDDVDLIDQLLGICLSAQASWF